MNVPLASTDSGETTEKLLLQYRGPHSLLFKSKLKASLPKLRIIFTTTKYTAFLNLPKSPVQLSSKFKAIYEYSCPSCSATYIGRTKRLLYHRMNEHFKAELGDHHSACKNEVSFYDCFKIIDTASSFKDLCILETIYILHYKPSLNLSLIHI